MLLDKLILDRANLALALALSGCALIGGDILTAGNFVDVDIEYSEELGQLLINQKEKGLTIQSALGLLAMAAGCKSFKFEDAETKEQSTEQKPVATGYTRVKVSGKKKKKAPNILELIINSYKPHALITCETGTGKTFFLLGLIELAYKKTQGFAEFYLASVKDGNYLGLQNEQDQNGLSRVAILPMTENEAGRMLAAANLINKQLEAVLNNLDARAKMSKECQEKGEKKPKFAPIYAVLDEFPTILSLLNENGFRELAQSILTKVSAIARVGREFKGRVIILGQGYQVNSLGLNTDLKLNFIHLILGRFYQDSETGQDIEACSVAKKAFGIEGSNAIFKKEMGQKHWARFSQAMRQHKGRPIVWSDISDIVVAPNLAGIDSKTINWKQNTLTTGQDPWENVNESAVV